MSTKVATLPPAITEQTRPTIYDSIRAASTAIFSGTQSITNVSYATVGSVDCAVYKRSEKAFEAKRQIDRLKSLTCVHSSGSEEDNLCLDSITSSISLIGSFLTSPVPIPVASSGSDGATTLFFEDDDFYGDLEVRGKFVEYYIKYAEKDGSKEVYETEPLGNGYIPPKLLTCLFSYYARG